MGRLGRFKKAIWLVLKTFILELVIHPKTLALFTFDKLTGKGARNGTPGPALGSLAAWVNSAGKAKGTESTLMTGDMPSFNKVF